MKVRHIDFDMLAIVVSTAVILVVIWVVAF
jgi:hypothetical protein